jgi:hypothetical protein
VAGGLPVCLSFRLEKTALSIGARLFSKSFSSLFFPLAVTAKLLAIPQRMSRHETRFVYAVAD